MTYREFLARTLTVVLILVLVALLWQLRTIVLMIFLSSIIAVTLSIPVQLLRRMRVARGIAIALTVLGVGGILLAIGTLILPEMVTQTANLVEDLPDAAEQAADEYTEWRERDELAKSVLPSLNFDKVEDSLTIREGEGEEENPESLITFGALRNFVLPVLTRAGNFVAGVAANILIILIVSLYFLVDPMDYVRGSLMLVPRNYQGRFLEIMTALQRALVAWLSGLTLSISITAILVYVGLGLILDIPNAMGLGVIAGLATIIPNIGSIIPLIPIVIFTLAHDPGQIVFVIPMYLAIQQIESNLITPRIVKQNLNIPAGVTMAFQLIAAVLFGFLGILLAVPMLAVIITLIRELYVYDTLGLRGVHFDIKLEENGDLRAVEVPALPKRKRSARLSLQKRLESMLVWMNSRNQKP